MNNRKATGMLTLLAAHRHPQLKHCSHLPITDLGPHLERMLGRWMHIHGGPVSPSVEKALRLISKIHEVFLQDM